MAPPPPPARPSRRALRAGSGSAAGLSRGRSRRRADGGVRAAAPRGWERERGCGGAQPAREEPGAAHHQVRVAAAGGQGRRARPQAGAGAAGAWGGPARWGGGFTVLRGDRRFGGWSGCVGESGHSGARCSRCRVPGSLAALRRSPPGGSPARFPPWPSCPGCSPASANPAGCFKPRLAALSSALLPHARVLLDLFSVVPNSRMGSSGHRLKPEVPSEYEE